MTTTTNHEPTVTDTTTPAPTLELRLPVDVSEAPLG